MPRFQREITINRPVEEVFDFVTDGSMPMRKLRWCTPGVHKASSESRVFSVSVFFLQTRGSYEWSRGDSNP
jgi:carbon monoxide dehydrogenase subunit G